MKEDHYSLAKNIFEDSNIKITVDGHRHLAAAGIDELKKIHERDKVKKWEKLENEINILSYIAKP